MTEFHFLQPVDVLYLRGNRLFADASTPGDALMPPWPSLISGALRSHILARHNVDVGKFAQGEILPEKLLQSLGSVENPGSFRLANFLLAKVVDGQLQDIHMPVPTDVVVMDQQIKYLQPERLSDDIQYNAPCEQIPILRTDKQSKADNGLWLNKLGIEAWLNAEPVTSSHLLKSDQLWKIDSRLGIALDGGSRTTIESQLYTIDAVAMVKNMGFLVGVDGAAGLLPEHGMIRLGGDGRSAEQIKVDWKPFEPDWNCIQNNKRFRLCLTTPGLFQQGWLPPGISEQNGQLQWQTSEFSAHLVSSTVPRSETVSGWDLANNSPKPALNAVSRGSVYWFDCFEGEVEALVKLVKKGLFSISGYPDNKRCAEGFNNIMIAAWPR